MSQGTRVSFELQGDNSTVNNPFPHPHMPKHTIHTPSLFDEGVYPDILKQLQDDDEQPSKNYYWHSLIPSSSSSGGGGGGIREPISSPNVNYYDYYKNAEQQQQQQQLQQEQHRSRPFSDTSRSTIIQINNSLPSTSSSSTTSSLSKGILLTKPQTVAGSMMQPSLHSVEQSPQLRRRPPSNRRSDKTNGIKEEVNLISNIEEQLAQCADDDSEQLFENDHQDVAADGDDEYDDLYGQQDYDDDEEEDDLQDNEEEGGDDSEFEEDAKYESSKEQKTSSANKNDRNHLHGFSSNGAPSSSPPPPLAPPLLEATILPPIKRGRGRPRKYPLPVGFETDPSFAAKKLADAENRRRYKEEMKKKASELATTCGGEHHQASAGHAADSDDSEMDTKDFSINSTFLKSFRQRLIGRSSNSKIFELKESRTDKLIGMVVKEVPHKMSNLHQAECYELHNEFKFLKKMEHPRVISLSTCDGFNNGEFVRDRNFCGILLPQAQCNLMEFAKTQRHGKACLVEIRIAMRQISEAVLYLHNQFISHNDIKPDNMFVFGEGDYKLADFGFAIDLPRPMEFRNNSHLQQSLRRQAKIDDLKKNWKMRCKQYVAPELIKLLNGKRPRNASDEKACDVFALGVSFFIIIFYQLPFCGSALPTDQRFKHFFKNNHEKFWTQFTSIFIKFNLQDDSRTDQLKDLFNQMLDPNPEARITIEAVLAHPWLNQGGQV